MIFFELMGIPDDDPFTKEQRMPPKYEIASPYFAQEAIKNDRYCREVRLMSWYELHTTEDVTAFRDKRKAELLTLERERKAVDNRRRSQVPEHEILKIVRMYEPIITEFFDNEEEMAKFQKWREEYEEKE